MDFNLDIDLRWKKTIFNNSINLSVKFKLRVKDDTKVFYTGQFLPRKLPQAVEDIVDIILITKKNHLCLIFI